MLLCLLCDGVRSFLDEDEEALDKSIDPVTGENVLPPAIEAKVRARPNVDVVTPLLSVDELLDVLGDTGSGTDLAEVAGKIRAGIDAVFPSLRGEFNGVADAELVRASEFTSNLRGGDIVFRFAKENRRTGFVLSDHHVARVEQAEHND